MSTLLSKKIPAGGETVHIKTEVFHSGNEYAKRMFIPQGFLVKTHKHKFDHLSLLVSGKVVVNCDGEQKGYTGDSCIIIKKNVAHSILALEDSVWYCIHGTTEHNLALIDETLVNE